MIVVIAGIIIKDGKVLLAKRGSNQKMAGKWEFPGGKLEKGETHQQCLERELKEELNIDVEVLDKFKRSQYENKEQNWAIDLIGYNCRLLSQDFKLNVHDELAWVSMQEIDSFDMPVADIPFVEKLKQFIS